MPTLHLIRRPPEAHLAIGEGELDDVGDDRVGLIALNRTHVEFDPFHPIANESMDVRRDWWHRQDGRT